MLTRRHFLGVGAVAAAGALMPVRAFAASHALASERALNFVHTHTGERLAIDYCSGGEYLPPALGSINYLLRDFRVDAIKPIDPQLLDLLFQLNGALGTEQPFHVISGYRLHETAASLRLGGVGYYPASDFVHVDTGRVRYW